MNQFTWFSLLNGKKRIKFSCSQQIFFFSQLQISYFIFLLFFILNQSFLSFHRAKPTYFLICFYSYSLKFLYGLLQFNPNSWLISSKLNNSSQSIFSFYPKFGQILIKFIQLRVIWYICNRQIKLLIIRLQIYWNQATVLPLFFHLLKNLNQIFKLLSQFLTRCTSYSRQFHFISKICFIFIIILNISITAYCSHSYKFNICLFNILMNPFRNSFNINFSFLSIHQSSKPLFCIRLTLKLLKTSIQIQLMHLFNFNRYSQLIEYIIKFIHTQYCRLQFPFMQDNNKQIMYIFDWILSLNV